jgi:hypothetical protein
VVAVSDTHGGQEAHDLLMTLISDSRPWMVNDIEVEFGHAFHQDRRCADSGSRVVITCGCQPPTTLYGHPQASAAPPPHPPGVTRPVS